MKKHLQLRRKRIWAIMFAYGTVRWQIPKPSTNKGTTVITGKLVVGWKSMQIHLLLWHKYFGKMYRVIN